MVEEVGALAQVILTPTRVRIQFSFVYIVVFLIVDIGWELLNGCPPKLRIPTIFIAITRKILSSLQSSRLSLLHVLLAHAYPDNRLSFVSVTCIVGAMKGR